MDLLQEIRKKVKLDESLSTSEGIQAVITHIERAEGFLAIGKRDDDINYFRDVIYRTKEQRKMGSSTTNSDLIYA
jgi:hypothetical protein